MTCFDFFRMLAELASSARHKNEHAMAICVFKACPPRRNFKKHSRLELLNLDEKRLLTPALSRSEIMRRNRCQFFLNWELREEMAFGYDLLNCGNIKPGMVN